MIKAGKLENGEFTKIDNLVGIFRSHQEHIRVFSRSLLVAFDESTSLQKLIHSIKHRIKDPDHLKDKLIRKFIEAKNEGKEFSINKDNFFNEINDSVGIRILHLHTDQIDKINIVLREIFDNLSIAIIGKPFARTWDDENRKLFKSCGFDTQTSPSMYTSVHYVVQSNSKIPITGEIQVRTLMEEVWGEVDHQINYPHKTDYLPSKEQLRVLARVTSSATRLVDSIFRCIQGRGD